MKKKLKLARLAWVLPMATAALLAAPQAFACFTVYNRANQIVYNAQTPPVDMRYQIHEVLPNVYPGGHMVFGNDPDCPMVSANYQRTAVVARSGTRQEAGGRLRPKPDRN